MVLNLASFFYFMVTLIIRTCSILVMNLNDELFFNIFALIKSYFQTKIKSFEQLF